MFESLPLLLTEPIWSLAGDGKADAIYVDKFTSDSTVFQNRGQHPSGGSSFDWGGQGILYDGQDRGENFHFPSFWGQRRADYHRIIPRTNEVGSHSNSETRPRQTPSQHYDVVVLTQLSRLILGSIIAIPAQVLVTMVLYLILAFHHTREWLDSVSLKAIIMLHFYRVEYYCQAISF
jgi:hypothetical protein